MATVSSNPASEGAASHMSVWFESKDWPLAGPEWPGTFPQTTRSESGIEYVLDLDKTGKERCLHPRRLRGLDGPTLVICIMPVGHDTPHMPMSVQLEDQAGPMMVRSMRKVA